MGWRISTVVPLVIAVLVGGCRVTPPKQDAAPAPSDSELADLRRLVPAPVPRPPPEGLYPGEAVVLVVDEDPPSMQPRIKFMAVVQEDSTVTLLSNQVFTTTGKTHHEIRREVHDRYVPKFFENVRLMDMDPPFYIVRGEVWSPGMRAIYRPTTVLKAIESAGGFTPSADRKKVQLIRQEAKQMINCAKAQQDPKMDVEILAHDQIFVPRSFWK